MVIELHVQRIRERYRIYPILHFLKLWPNRVLICDEKPKCVVEMRD